jgi:hypothetical protein
MANQAGRREIFDLNDVQAELEQSPFEDVQTEQEESSSDVHSEGEQSNHDIESEEEESQPLPSPQNLEEARVRINELQAALKTQAKDHDRAISNEDTAEEEIDRLHERLQDAAAARMAQEYETERRHHRALELIAQRDVRIEFLERENQRLRRKIDESDGQRLSNNGFSQYPSYFWRNYDRRQVDAMREFTSQRD